MAGNWSGGGTVTLDDGSRERLRCRASYAVAGAQMTMTLTCASDAYKFQLGANVVDQGGAVSGNWTETSRNISGTLQGRGGGGSFDVLASTGGFNANISLRTSGNKQSISMRADSQFRAAAISLSLSGFADEGNLRRIAPSPSWAGRAGQPFPSWFLRRGAPAPW